MLSCLLIPHNVFAFLYLFIFHKSSNGEVFIYFLYLLFISSITSHYDEIQTII